MGISQSVVGVVVLGFVILTGGIVRYVPQIWQGLQRRLHVLLPTLLLPGPSLWLPLLVPRALPLLRSGPWRRALRGGKAVFLPILPSAGVGPPTRPLEVKASAVMAYGDC